MMVISQLSNIFGIAWPIDASSSNMIAQFFQVLGRLGEARFPPFILGILVIIGAFAAARVNSKLPAPLIGVLVAFAAGQLFGLTDKEAGKLPLTLPDFAGFSWTSHDVFNVLPSAFALAFVTSVNLLITSPVLAHLRGRHQHLQFAAA